MKTPTKVWVVKEDSPPGHPQYYHTGEISREMPPGAYLGTRREAAEWFSEAEAARWAKLYGGTVMWDTEHIDPEPEFRAHIICEDPRYPLLCINGKFNYGVFIDPDTGEIERERKCICGSSRDECICDLDD